MDLIYISVAISLGVVALIYGWKFNWVWFITKKLEKSLKQQGFNGNSYKFMLGDLNEITAMEKESLSKSITSFSHDFSPRILRNKFITRYERIKFIMAERQYLRFGQGLALHELRDLLVEVPLGSSATARCHRRIH
ncbi:hypothetical protein C2S53_005349 [Perilla frutescens var. hirtella]|uniref:Uncharacterized protein n=1 Tax=Perilla frutescens var. hirtella TaxID=608512 RepID=A0AAD4JHF1_PERFH|nr:hypothetical protein C2S53_005349 [Perilla frutescens var. hirtella]